MLQVGLLVLFAAGAVLCFYFRLRVAMTQGAAARGDKTPAQAADEVARFERGARRSAIVSALSLVLCILAGAAVRFA